MRLTIFSDVHSNWVAFQAVLADMDAQGKFDQILSAGDLAHGGPQPNQCVEAAIERGIQGVYGNSEERIINEEAPVPSYILENPEWLLDYQIMTRWTRKQLKPKHLSYLESLSFSLTISPTSNPNDNLLIVHATPHSVTHGILPSEEWQLHHLKKVRQSDTRVLELLAGVQAHTIAYGHVHVPGVRHVGDYQLINVSSVSRAQDWDLRAKYAILEFKNGAWHAEYRYVEYDIDRAIQAFLDSDMPNAEGAVRWLQGGGEDNW